MRLLDEDEWERINGIIVFGLGRDAPRTFFLIRVAFLSLSIWLSDVLSCKREVRKQLAARN